MSSNLTTLNIIIKLFLFRVYICISRKLKDTQKDHLDGFIGLHRSDSMVSSKGLKSHKSYNLS